MKKTTKKKWWKYVIAAVLILAISFVYAHIDKQIPVFDKSVDTSLYVPFSELITGSTVSQTFTCERDVLDGVSVKLITYGEDTDAKYRYQVAREDTGKVVRRGKFSTKDVKNGKYLKLDFDTIKKTLDETFVLTLMAEDADQGTGVSVYAVPQAKAKYAMTLNQKPAGQYTVAMKTDSRLFDLETFFAVAFTLAYLYIFITLLVRFFS